MSFSRGHIPSSAGATCSSYADTQIGPWSKAHTHTETHTQSRSSAAVHNRLFCIVSNRVLKNVIFYVDAVFRCCWMWMPLLLRLPSRTVVPAATAACFSITEPQVHFYLLMLSLCASICLSHHQHYQHHHRYHPH